MDSCADAAESESDVDGIADAEPLISDAEAVMLKL